MKTGNRIWIELDKPENELDAQNQCDLANRMLERLGFKGMEFWVGKRGYNITTSKNGGYLECADRGHWFNLDFAAGEQK